VIDMLNKELRSRILIKGTEMESTHFSSAYSCLDAIKYLYDHVIRPEKDIFIMSKAHGEMALFAVLESIGKSPKWTVHLDYDESNGVYATTGSLGHGLPIALGRAMGKKIKSEDGFVYVLLGDGEMEEGSNWEALTIANNKNIKNLVVLIDWNKYQATDSVLSVASLDSEALVKKLRAFGFNTTIINGHDIEDLSYLKRLPVGLNAVILDTIKGKGIPFLEQNHSHGFDFSKNKDMYLSVMKELK